MLFSDLVANKDLVRYPIVVSGILAVGSNEGENIGF